MSIPWALIGRWIAKALAQKAIEELSKGLAEGKSPTAEP